MTHKPAHPPTRVEYGPLFRMLTWLLEGLDIDRRDRLPVRVFYKFETGCWRVRSTRQLQKVYRCR
jgi:hypothetical protein